MHPGQHSTSTFLIAALVSFLINTSRDERIVPGRGGSIVRF